MNTTFDFKDDRREISCRTVNTVIKYVQQQHKDVKSLLDGLPYDEKYLTDTNNWVSSEIQDEIYRRLRAMYDDDEILYKVASASEELHSLGFIDYIARLMSDPHFIIKQAPNLIKYFDRTKEMEVIKFGLTGATIKYYTKAGCEIDADDCYYLRGTLAALLNIWKVGPGKTWEETCCVPIHKKGRMNGKFYTVDDSGNVSEHDALEAKSGNDKPKIIGRLNSDGTFKLRGTIYGTKHCLYHVSWSAINMCFKRIPYELFTKPKILTETIEEMLRENDLIQQKYEELYQNDLKLQKYYVDTISAFIRAIDAKDHYTEDHSFKVARIAEAVAMELRLPPDKIETIRTACKLHDLGKIGVKESILLKPGKLTDEEWKDMKKHPILGAEIIRPLTFLSDVAVLIREDHERWDGKGYPDGLKEGEINVGARIIALSDAYDAMISGRPYKKAMSKYEAIEEVKRNSGTQFDPIVVEAFLKVASELPPSAKTRR